MDTDASGQAMLFLSDDESRLTYWVSVESIDNITAANIENENGDVVHELFDGTGAFDPDNPISGTLALTTSQRDDLTAGNYYVNVETSRHSEGEIRGQVELQQQYWAFETLLSGDQEAPPIATGGRGQGTLVLNANQTQLAFRISVENIEEITAAYVHRGQLGENGPMIHQLYDGAGSFDPDNPISGMLELSAVDVDDLMSGNFYVQVETTEYPDGEIRGQIVAFTPASDYEARLSGASEVPPVTTDRWC